ncbi:MAG: DUF1501 domain-containing protein [Planctomycetales bacterium]|nr:DUF1501 domain-containing protein [Planctomycetales bacterium]
MLSFQSTSRCGRREFLRVGSLGLGGLSLSHGLGAGFGQPLFGDIALSRVLKDRSVIFLFLHGGPSQTETFDPKMTAPTEIQSVTGEIKTALPGITFGSSFPRLAKLADKFSVVRSFQTGDGNHDIKPIVSRHSINANLGSLYARIAGTTSATGMPNNVAIFPRAIDPNAQPAVKQFGDFAASGTLGSAYAPFVLGGGGLYDDMKLNLAPDRLEDRRQLIRELDNAKRLFDSDRRESLGRIRNQAFETILGGVSKAFDWTQEDASTIERYNTAPLMRPEQINRKWNNYNNYVDNAQTLGKLLLLSRRLCESGCGFVTVTTNFVWDMHADINNATMHEGMQYMGGPLDYALSAFIEDVEARGLRDKILFVACGEMGRTPKLNDRGGRDHWGRIAPLLVYGGGLKMGQVVGESTKDAGEPASHPYRIENLIATIMHSQADVGRLRLLPNLPTDLLRVATSSEPISELI